MPINIRRDEPNIPRDLTPRPVKDSTSETQQRVLPGDTNAVNGLLGGTLMHWIDIIAATAAHRHSRSWVVTASVDHLDFLVPARMGELVVLRASVNRAFNTSMEVGVKVWVENAMTGTIKHVSSAYLTFVAIDYDGKPQAVPPIVPETEEEKRRYNDAGARREIRTAEAKRKKAGQKA